MTAWWVLGKSTWATFSGGGAGYVDFFKPILIGAEALDMPLLWERLYRCGKFWCRNGMGAMALTGIEGAVWDLKGKAEQKPVWELLGGKCHERLLGIAMGGWKRLPV
jgi:L-alanine-DL-glutamate epimerase-like enolase superfamily enzyme